MKFHHVMILRESDPLEKYLDGNNFETVRTNVEHDGYKLTFAMLDSNDKLVLIYEKDVQ